MSTVECLERDVFERRSRKRKDGVSAKMISAAHQQSTIRRRGTGMVPATRSLTLLHEAEQALSRGDGGHACDLFEQLISTVDANQTFGATAELYSNYSAALFLVGRYQDAEVAALHATESAPECVEAWCNVGTARQARGDVHNAVDAYRIALELDPEHRDSQINLALACEQLGDSRAAVNLLSWVVERVPENFEANFELGRILISLNRPADATTYLTRATASNPSDADAVNLLGVAFRKLGREAEAAKHFRRASDLAPKSPVAFINLSRVYKELGRLDDAVAAGRKALSLDRQAPEAMNNLASALRSQGRVEEAVGLFATATQKSSDPKLASNRLCAEQYVSNVTRRQLFDLHTEWAQRFAPGKANRRAPQHTCTGRSVRVGFVSPDLGRHPIGYFLSGLLANLSESEIETFCYSDRLSEDSLTSTLKSRSTHWRQTATCTDRELAQKISDDGIDVLIDLAGHTCGNRLLMFAQRAAPVQASWLGYVGTTGLESMDYVIADRYHVRDGEGSDYVEAIANLPDGYLCYEPHHNQPVNSLPALTNHAITFGAFHNPAKINAGSLATWCRVLNEVPESRLVLKYWGFESSEVQKRIRQLVQHGNVDPLRVEFRRATDHGSHIAAFHDIDIMLDPRPYSGGLTTCEALWMGVPVITWPGETFAGRHSASHLTNAGFSEYVCDSEDQYVDVAVSLCRDLEALAEIRQTMRSRVAASPLCDTQRFTKNFAEMIRELCDR